MADLLARHNPQELGPGTLSQPFGRFEPLGQRADNGTDMGGRAGTGHKSLPEFRNRTDSAKNKGSLGQNTRKTHVISMKNQWLREISTG
jgi:hypothetical protein